MKLPTLHGYIDRRILVNYVADPTVVSKMLPAPFRPKVYKGVALVGICLIRLKHIKPKGFPDFLGFASENGAHRIAVEWEEPGAVKEGVYIPRRDTSSRLNALVGGRLFPGKHHLAKFDVRESNGQYHVAFSSDDDTHVLIEAKEGHRDSFRSIFDTFDEASEFFRNGSLGYSPHGKGFDGMWLRTLEWELSALEVSRVYSSFFEDATLFPQGSLQFDHALIMTQLEHEWKRVPNIQIVKPIAVQP